MQFDLTLPGMSVMYMFFDNIYMQLFWDSKNLRCLYVNDFQSVSLLRKYYATYFLTH